MSDAIKAGDLVMIVKKKSCCGSGHVGYIFKAMSVSNDDFGRCPQCGYENLLPESVAFINATEAVVISRLKKINPPAIGDSLPTRASLDTPIKELA